MRYRVKVDRSAEKRLRKFPPDLYAVALYKIEALGEDPWPPGCKKMEGQKDSWRIRIGDYRIVYSVFKDILLVYVTDAGPRGNVYKRR